MPEQFSHHSVSSWSQPTPPPASTLKPGGSFGLVCFRPEGGGGYTDQQVYEHRSLGGGLGYSEDRLRALWDEAPFSVQVLRHMTKTDGQGPCFGEDFLWALLATKEGSA